MENTQLSLFGKMCPEHIAATKERTLESSSKNSKKPPVTVPILCLNRQKESGSMPEKSWEIITQSHGEHLTLNSGECPSVVVESTLSQILEVNAPEKYYLSAKACEGILRRAGHRGKELPEMLKTALEQQIERTV